MTTEKEFWEFTGRYFRTVASIKDVIDDLQAFSTLPKDLRAIKSMKKIENIMKDFGKPENTIIDEGCVGCAGPCMVVDVAANLQKELDECRKLALNESRRVECDTELIEKLHREYCAVINQQRTTIKDLQKELDSCQMLVDSYKTGLENRDETIRKAHAIITQQKTTIENFKAIETRETDRLHKIIDELQDDINGLEVEVDAFPDNYLDVVAKRDEIIKQHETTIEELKDRNNKDLNELYKLDKAEIDCLKSRLAEKRAIVDRITNLRANEVETLYALKAELSTRKGDSEVLMKVVEAVKQYDGSYEHGTMHTFDHVLNILDDYLDAPEGPPETPIDETPNIAIVFTFGEIL